VQAARGAPLNAQDSPAADAAAASAAGKPGRPRRVGLLLGVAAFVLAADVITKAVVVTQLAHHPPIRLLGGLLTITLTRNGGAAFSIGTSMTIVFTAIAVGVIVYILRTARNLRSIGWAITLGLLLGGATGNLLDRIFRAPGPFQGHVVDWIQLPDWPVFNLADSAIVCAGVLVVLLALRGIRLDGTRPLAEASSSHPATSEPDLSQPDPSVPHSSDPDYPKSEYPEPQSAVPSPADSSDRLADDSR
jgi:signal peptidase II